MNLFSGKSFCQLRGRQQSKLKLTPEITSAIEYLEFITNKWLNNHLKTLWW